MPFNFAVKPNVLREPMGNLMGFCDLIVDDILVVTGFKVSKNSKTGELFVSNPSTQSKKIGDDGKPVWFDSVRFVDTKDEDAKQTPWQKEVYSTMLEEFRKAQGGSTTPTRNTNLPPKTDKTPTKTTSTVTAKSNPLWS